MGKKKGKKGKKKKVVDPFALTHLERETMHLQIETVGHKIRWRKQEMAEDRGRVERLLEEHARRVARRAKAVEALERSMEERRSLHNQISIPLIERQRWEAKTRRLREVASEVLSFSKERRSHAASASAVREEIGAEERHDAQEAAARIASMEAQLAAPPPGQEGEEAGTARREDFLQSEMMYLFARRMEKHQRALRKSVDPINLKISEETRWYRDSEHLLRTERERLLSDTQAKLHATARAKESIACRKEATRAAKAELRAIKGRSAGLERRNQELRDTAEAESRAEAEAERLRLLLREAQEGLSRAKEELEGGVSQIAEKEEELSALEAEMERVGVAGRALERRKERAEEAVRSEMEDTFKDGPSDLVEELVGLLERSAADVRENLRA